MFRYSSAPTALPALDGTPAEFAATMPGINYWQPDSFAGDYTNSDCLILGGNCTLRKVNMGMRLTGEWACRASLCRYHLL